MENAYEHGMKNCLEGGMIRIRTDYQDGYFSFCVEDNGDGLKEDELMELKRKISIEEINSKKYTALPIRMPESGDGIKEKAAFMWTTGRTADFWRW